MPLDKEKRLKLKKPTRFFAPKIINNDQISSLVMVGTDADFAYCALIVIGYGDPFSAKL
jgi:hypothetical protein